MRISGLLLSLVLAGVCLGAEQKPASTPHNQGPKLLPDRTRTWVSITENGDRPGFALVLIEKVGKAMDGKFYILDANHPRDLSKGKSYDLFNVSQDGKRITATASNVHQSSKTHPNMDLTIVLKEAFDGDRVRAEWVTGGVPLGYQSRSIVFERIKEQPTLEQRIAMLQRAEQFADEHKLRLWENQEPPILPLEGKWYRVRLGLVGKPDGANTYQLLVSSDGRVVDGMNRTEVVKLLGELVPNLQTDADHQRYLEKYILAIHPDETLVVSGPSDIPGYERSPLAKDLAAVIRPPWRLEQRDVTWYVFYTWERRMGIVKRWQCRFYDGKSLSYSDTTVLGRFIGNGTK